MFWILKFRELSVLVFKNMYSIRNTQSERINYELHRKSERVILIRVRMLIQLIPTLPGGHKNHFCVLKISVGPSWKILTPWNILF